MSDDIRKKGGLFGLGTDDANDNGRPDREAELDDVPSKSNRRIRLERSNRLELLRADQKGDILLEIIPENLRADIAKLSRGFNAVTDICVEIFVHLGEEGLQLVSSLEFLHKQEKISVVKQDLDLLKAFLIKFHDQCLDYDLDPIPMLRNLVKSEPNITMSKLIEIALGQVMKMLVLAYPARLQGKLAALDWELGELAIFIQNWEMANRESRYLGFQYAERYINSAEETGGSKNLYH